VQSATPRSHERRSSSPPSCELFKHAMNNDDILWLYHSGNGKHGDVKSAFEASLKALGTDYIDLYLMHWPQAVVNGT
jgi:aryl-alcohol dehydrogenase-like predicted oxidoreductase